MGNTEKPTNHTTAVSTSLDTVEALSKSRWRRWPIRGLWTADVVTGHTFLVNSGSPNRLLRSASSASTSSFSLLSSWLSIRSSASDQYRRGSIRRNYTKNPPFWKYPTRPLSGNKSCFASDAGEINQHMANEGSVEIQNVYNRVGVRGVIQATA